MHNVAVYTNRDYTFHFLIFILVILFFLFKKL
uniref:Uncharacterized protein n=1 Tax=Anguilla anguilla TaxID=7936 RepID=A0A0E9T423_ANGAN